MLSSNSDHEQLLSDQFRWSLARHQTKPQSEGQCVHWDAAKGRVCDWVLICKNGCWAMTSTVHYISPHSLFQCFFKVGYLTGWLMGDCLRLRCLGCYDAINRKIDAFFFSSKTEWLDRGRAIYFIWQEIQMDSISPPLLYYMLLKLSFSLIILERFISIYHHTSLSILGLWLAICFAFVYIKSVWIDYLFCICLR